MFIFAVLWRDLSFVPERDIDAGISVESDQHRLQWRRLTLALLLYKRRSEHLSLPWLAPSQRTLFEVLKRAKLNSLAELYEGEFSVDFLMKLVFSSDGSRALEADLLEGISSGLAPTLEDIVAFDSTPRGHYLRRLVLRTH